MRYDINVTVSKTQPRVLEVDDDGGIVVAPSKRSGPPIISWHLKHPGTSGRFLPPRWHKRATPKSGIFGEVKISDDTLEVADTNLQPGGPWIYQLRAYVGGSLYRTLLYGERGKKKLEKKHKKKKKGGPVLLTYSNPTIKNK